MSPKVLRTLALALIGLPLLTQAQLFKPRSPTPPPMQQQPQQQKRGFFGFGNPKKPAELINRQQPLKVNQGVLKQASPENTHVVVSIPKQRAFLMVGEQIAADEPISSGKVGHGTPTGNLSVLEKDPNHHSNIYGNFVDHEGRIVRAGVSAKVDSAPSGTHFEGAPMTWFLRLTEEGVGMHIGILPGYPASHGCVREPSDGAKLFYDYTRVGTKVDVGDY
jgi:lipoprotein-anchoring transpeptidase ErfK/SrfK